MPTIKTTNQQIFTRPEVNVYINETFPDVAAGETWTKREHVHAVSCSKKTGQSLGSAVLVWDMGYILYEGTEAYAQYDYLPYERYFVKLEWMPNTGIEDTSTVDQAGDDIEGDLLPVTWYGIVVSSERSRLGGNDASAWNGRQVMRCATLDWLLAKKVILTSRVGKFDADDDKLINRGMVFNAQVGQRDHIPGVEGNQFSRDDDKGQVFSNDLEPLAVVPWTSLNIIKYLLDVHNPFRFSTNPGGADLTLSLDANASVPWYKPRNVVTHGRTLYDVLNQVINPTFGYDWTIEVDEANRDIQVHIHSMTGVGINMPSGETWLANIDIVSLNFEEAFDITNSLEVIDATNQYRQVIVSGQPKGVVCTLDYILSNQLIAGWTDALETEYLDGGINIPGWDNFDYDTKVAAMSAIQSSERLKHVYTNFILEPDISSWIIDPFIAMDEVTGDVDPAETVEVWGPGLSIKNRLPLQDDVDYSDPDLATISSLDAKPGSRPIMGFYKHVQSGEWFDLKRLTSVPFHSIASFGGDNFTFNSFAHNVRVSVAENGKSIWAVPSSAFNHYNGGLDFYNNQVSPIDGQPGRARIDWKNFFFTVYMQYDENLEVKHPTLSDVDDAENELVSEIKFINLGNRGRWDYIAFGTIVGIDSDQNVITVPEDTVIHSDFEWMQDIARASYEWYSKSRKSFSMSFKQMSGLFSPGTFIDEIGSAGGTVAFPGRPPEPTVGTLESVNSMITSVEWNFEAGTTTINTSFAKDINFVNLG